MADERLIEMLNNALAWELRAMTLYAHYASYVKGIHRLHLAPMFLGEATESSTHAGQIRDAIAKLGGVAVTRAADVEIVHTEDYSVMLNEALMTEQRAAAYYREILDELDSEEELFDVVQQIQFAEERSVSEIKMLV
jgi:bacterioferritin (cytochrome b1)